MARSLPRISGVLLAALAVVAPGIGPAGADVGLPVQYLVERDPLRAVAPGQSLSFELYGDPACSAEPVHTERLVVGPSGVSAERLELEAGQSQTRVTPAAVRLTTTLKRSAGGRDERSGRGFESLKHGPAGDLCAARAGKQSTQGRQSIEGPCFHQAH